MPSIKEYIQKLFDANNISYSDKQAAVFTEFVSEEDNIFAFHQIVDNQNILITRFMRKVAIFDIIHQHLQIPNGTVNKPYLHTIDLAKLGNGQITTTALPDIEKYGLSYNTETATITGTPTQSGDFKVALHFNIAGEDDLTPPHLKTISLVINADPKSLWKNIPSDEGQDDAWRHKNHWKADNAMATAPLGGKHLVVASKRGRSHANVGSFRDDDFAFEHFAENGWSIVCVADGAGSAKLSRRGSQLACEAVVKYFAEQFTADVLAEADRLIQERSENPGEDNQKGLSAFLYKYAGGAAFSAHQTLEAAANKMEVSLKDLHSTLIFALFKQYEFGYAIFSFGVGDCPIAVLNTSMTEVKLMNWLDVGEFGGGTRFITMSEIFQSDKFATRFGFQLMPDFSYLILMTDGIYDPKFVVEANLEKPVHWQAFIADLKGDNEDKKQVHFDPANTAIAQELSDWMDFWSPGNHDDRTLAIVF